MQLHGKCDIVCKCQPCTYCPSIAPNLTFSLVDITADFDDSCFIVGYK